MDDKILNNRFDSVDFGNERTSNLKVSISPFVEDMYKENLSDNIDDVYIDKSLMDLMNELYVESEFYDKYGQTAKKIDRRDLMDIYYYFKNKLLDTNRYTIVQIFCAISDFFDINYKTLYNDVITLEDKVEILETLEDMYGLESQFSKSNRLF